MSIAEQQDSLNSKKGHTPVTRCSIFLIAIAVLFLCANVAQGDSATNSNTLSQNDIDQFVHDDSGRFFSIDVPKGFKLEGSFGLDAHFYDVKDEHSVYVTIYGGEALKYPAIPLASDERALVLRMPRMKMISYWKGQSLEVLQLLVLRRQPIVDPPSYVVAWTNRDAPNKQLAQQILLSLRVDDECSKENRVLYGFCGIPQSLP